MAAGGAVQPDAPSAVHAVMKPVLTAVAGAWLAGVGALAAFTPRAAADPPRVVGAHPDHGDIGVDPSLTELRITFDQDMRHGGHSICGGGPGFPEITARPRWEDARTIVLPVRLEPGTQYRLSINCPAADNFRSAAGEPAEIYPIVFRTGGEGETPPSLRPERAAEMTAALRRLIDERYAHRDVRGIDWDDRFQRLRPRLESAPTPAAFARAAAELLRPNNDLHTWVEVNGIALATGRRAAAPNVDPRFLAQTIPGWREFPGGAAGRFEDGTGYIAITSWNGADEAAKASVIAALAELADAPRLIIDVRLNAGGDELFARRVASCFVESRTVYSRNLIRDPAAPGGWAGPFDRAVEPAPEGPRCRGKVAVLMGPACMSTCESFLLMMRQPGRRELFGAKSWGSSGNPKPHDLGEGVRVYLASWKDMTPDGREIEGVGIEPDHAVGGLPGAPGDPVLDAALIWLRGG